MKPKFLYSFFVLFLFVFCYSCKDNNNGNVDSTPPYNRNRAVDLESFTPIEGGMATRVILKGDNFGNDPKSVKVYFNHKQAPVVGCAHGRALVITPRQPGDECDISVVIGNDSVVYPEKFVYHTRTIVTTVVWQEGTTAFRVGSFAETTFSYPAYLTVDYQGNLFLSNWSGGTADVHFSLIDQERRMVTILATARDNPASFMVPTTDYEGKVVLAPAAGGDDANYDNYYEFDSEAQWAARTRKVLHPTIDDQKEGKVDFVLDAFKHSLAICMMDSMIYYRSNRDGKLIRFNPRTRKGEWATNERGEPIYFRQGHNADGYLAFGPVNKHILYGVLGGNNSHCVGWCNILTGESGILAGQQGTPGWRDGKLEDALFNRPRQMVVDNDGNLMIADNYNHCIRKIDLQTGIVTTVVGIAGKAGYKDGNPDDAEFRNPYGVTIDRRDGSIYVADYGNKVIRKLTIE